MAGKQRGGPGAGDPRPQRQETAREVEMPPEEIIQGIASLVDLYDGIEKGEYSIEWLDSLKQDDPQFGKLKADLDALRDSMDDPTNRWGSRMFGILADFAIKEGYETVEDQSGKAVAVYKRLEKPEELIKLLTSPVKKAGKRESNRETKLNRYNAIVHFAEKLNIPPGRRRYASAWACTNLIDKTWDQPMEKPEHEQWQQLANWALYGGRGKMRPNQYRVLQQFAKENGVSLTSFNFTKDHILESIIDRIWADRPLSDDPDHQDWTSEDFAGARKMLSPVLEWAVEKHSNMTPQVYEAFTYYVKELGLDPQEVKYTETYALSNLLTPTSDKIKGLIGQQEALTKGGLGGAALRRITGARGFTESEELKKWKTLAEWAGPALGMTLEDVIETITK